MEEAHPPKRMTYSQAGVDVNAASRLVDRIKELAKATHRPEVLAGVGPFSGLFRLRDYRDPVLVASAALRVDAGDFTLALGPRYFDERIAVQDMDLDATFRFGAWELGLSIENLVDAQQTRSELFLRFAF